MKRSTAKILSYQSYIPAKETENADHPHDDAAAIVILACLIAYEYAGRCKVLGKT